MKSAPDAEPALQVRGLTFSHEAKPFFAGLSLEIAAGTVTALVGPNGAGKTTLLACLAGVLVPHAGTVRVAGADFAQDAREVRRRTGYLPDTCGVWKELSVLGNLQHMAAAYGLPDAAQCARDTASLLGLDEMLDRRPGTFSLGQLRRLQLGMAVIHRPRLLLLDEPASGLDPEAREALAGLIAAMRNEGTAVVVSSHILAELSDFSDHLLLLDSGKIAEHRALENVLGRRVRMVLAEPNEDARAFIAARAEAEDVELLENGREIVFSLSGNDDGDYAKHLALLLRELLRATDCEVCGLSVVGRENLRDAYRRGRSAGSAAVDG